MIDALMCCLPLLGEDHVVLLYRILDDVGRGQNLLSILLGIRLNLMNLGPMGSPLLFRIIHLETRNVSEGHQKPFGHSSHPGFKLHNPG